jgi:hypothetical protein
MQVSVTVVQTSAQFLKGSGDSGCLLLLFADPDVFGFFFWVLTQYVLTFFSLAWQPFIGAP